MTDKVASLPLRFLEKWEETVLCLLLTAMIVLACLQIFLRSAFSSGLLWIDPFLRYLVMWCGLFGAVTATGQGKHIALDIVQNNMPKVIEPWITLFTHLFCFLTTLTLTWAGWLFIVNEFEAGGTGPLELPLWFWNGVFPLCFALIALKYLLMFLSQVKIVFTENRRLPRKTI